MSPPLRFPVSIHEFKAWQRRVSELELQTKASSEWQEKYGEELEALKIAVAGLHGKLDLLLQSSSHAPLKAGAWGGGLGSALWLLDKLIEFLSKAS